MWVHIICIKCRIWSRMHWMNLIQLFIAVMSHDNIAKFCWDTRSSQTDTANFPLHYRPRQVYSDSVKLIIILTDHPTGWSNFRPNRCAVIRFEYFDEPKAFLRAIVHLCRYIYVRYERVSTVFILAAYYKDGLIPACILCTLASWNSY